MKRRIPVLLVSALLVLGVVPPAVAQAPGQGRGGGRGDHRSDAGDPLAGFVILDDGTVVVKGSGDVLAAAPAASGLMTPGGGILSVTGDDGQLFTLAVPPGALLDPVTVTLTPVVAAGGLPLLRSPFAAVQAEPTGLRFLRPATLSVMLPEPPPPGVVGFSLERRRHGFKPQPAGVGGATLSMAVTHFSTLGWGISFCGANVTTAVGRDACEQMREALESAGEFIEEIDAIPLPVRVQLAAELATPLRTWIERFILPALDEAADLTATDRVTTDYFFFVALREYNAVQAILQLTEQLDGTVTLADELAAVDALIPQAFEIRRLVMNDRCLADRPQYRLHINDLLRLAAEADIRGLPVDPDTRGIDCVFLDLQFTYPDPVPAGGADFQGVATLRFKDQVPVLADFGPQPTVKIELDPIFAIIPLPRDARGPGEASLTGSIGPDPASSADLVRFRVTALVDELNLIRREVVTHCLEPTASSAAGRAGRATAPDADDGQCQAFDETGVFATQLFVTDITPGGGEAIYQDAFPDIAPGRQLIANVSGALRPLASRTVTVEPGRLTLIVEAQGVGMTDPHGAAEAIASISFALGVPTAYRLDSVIDTGGGRQQRQHDPPGRLLAIIAQRERPRLGHARSRPLRAPGGGQHHGGWHKRGDAHPDPRACASRGAGRGLRLSALARIIHEGVTVRPAGWHRGRRGRGRAEWAPFVPLATRSVALRANGCRSPGAPPPSPMTGPGRLARWPFVNNPG